MRKFYTYKLLYSFLAKVVSYIFFSQRKKISSPSHSNDNTKVREFAHKGSTNMVKKILVDGWLFFVMQFLLSHETQYSCFTR